MLDSDYPLTRRNFITIGIGAGFAAAVIPISSWAILTPSEGLTAGPVSIPTGSESMPGYRAMPKGKGPFPTVLVIHEIFGVHEYIQDVCRRLARQGFQAVSPYLYFRQGDVTRVEDIQQIRSRFVSKASQDQIFKDLDATLDWLKKSGSADLSRVGITGFCWGGGVTWMYAAHHPRLKAGVAWYGPLNGEHTPAQPRFPINIAPELHVPVLGLYAGKDKNIPQKDVEEMRQALKKGKSGSEIIVYPDADHGFHADYRPSYNEKDAKDGWNRMLEWFRKHGV